MQIGLVLIILKNLMKPHSILCILDGVSGAGDCNISKLNQASKSYMLHDQLYKKDI